MDKGSPAKATSWEGSGNREDDGRWGAAGLKGAADSGRPDVDAAKVAGAATTEVGLASICRKI